LNWFWWTVVDVADLEPDDPVLDVIDDAHPVASSSRRRGLEQLDEAQPDAIPRHRRPSLEADGHDLGLVRGQLRPRHQLEDVVVGRVAEVFDPSTLARAAP
jgi:hypothetical protein